MNYEAWFEHFKEQLQGLTESFDHSGSKLSLLGFALKENFLSSEEYLKWAMTHYKLPMLQSQFFTETSPSLELFAKWAALYRWSEECLPVAEWDGSLIIACLQPPQDFSSSESPIVVLTSQENLQRVWEKLNPSLSEKQLTQNVDDAPTGVDLSFATSLKKSPSDNFSIEDLGMAEIASDENQEEISLDENNDSEKKLSLAEGLEGLFDQPAVIELKGLSANTTDHNKTETLDENKVEKIVPAVEEQKLKPIPPPPAKIQPEAVKKEEDKSSSEESEASISLEQGTIIKPISRSTGIAKPTLNPAPLVGSFPLDKIKKRNSALLNEKIKTTLSQMKTQFEKAMILTLDDEEAQLMAFAWDENFQDIGDTASVVPLKTPSIFNIVSSTQKPFHGYISQNQINDDFFAGWNKGKVPEHVTISPILVNEKVIGMLLGFGTKDTYNRVSLNLAEKLSTEFTKGLIQVA